MDLNDISGERKFIERLKPFFSNVKNNLNKNLYLQRLSANFGINEFVLEEELKNLPNKTSKMKKRRIYENQKVQYKKQKRDLYIELEEQTLIYILEFFKSEKEKCIELLNKEFSHPIFNELIEKLKAIDFDIMKLDKIDISEENREIVTKDKDIKYKDSYFKDRYFMEVYSGWFEREIREESKKSEEENNKIKKIELKKLLLKMKNVNKIEEIKKLYDEFILIRRLGYV